MSTQTATDDPVIAGFLDSAARFSMLIERRLPIPSPFGTMEERAALKHSAVVYYITNTTGGAIKIGTTVCMAQRFHDLSRKKKFFTPLLLAWEFGGEAEERRRHIQFDHSRVYGEWFWPTDEVLTHVETLRGAL